MSPDSDGCPGYLARQEAAAGKHNGGSFGTFCPRLCRLPSQGLGVYDQGSVPHAVLWGTGGPVRAVTWNTLITEFRPFGDLPESVGAHPRTPKRPTTYHTNNPTQKEGYLLEAA